MIKFKREDRYIVIKIADREKYLSDDEKIQLALLTSKICEGRFNEGKDQIDCVIAKKGTPEYEIVWGMIEDRVI